MAEIPPPAPHHAPRENMLEGVQTSLALQLHDEATRLLGLLDADRWTEAVEDAQARFLQVPEVPQGDLSHPMMTEPRMPLSKGDYPLASFLQTKPVEGHLRTADMDRLRAFGLAAASYILWKHLRRRTVPRTTCCLALPSASGTVG